MTARLGDPPPQWTRDFAHADDDQVWSWRAYAHALTKRQIRGCHRRSINRSNNEASELGGEG